VARLLSDSDTRAIAEHVAAAERRTAGEIVVVVAERSAEYGTERAAVSLALTLLAAIALYLLVPHVSGLWILAGQAPLLLLLWWVAGQAGVLHRIVPRAEQEEQVQARAKQLFIDEGVTETRDRSGVLLFLSEAERRVELLADRGIHERVGKEAWQSTVDKVVGAIHHGQAKAGVLAAIDAIAENLARHFPPRDDDENELADAPRRV
jgi:putative membrane protein